MNVRRTSTIPMKQRRPKLNIATKRFASEKFRLPSRVSPIPFRLPGKTSRKSGPRNYNNEQKIAHRLLRRRFGIASAALMSSQQRSPHDTWIGIATRVRREWIDAPKHYEPQNPSDLHPRRSVVLGEGCSSLLSRMASIELLVACPPGTFPTADGYRRAVCS